MFSSQENLDRFKFALDTHEDLLHAETQAIAAKHLDTIEEILVKKEDSLVELVEAKNAVNDYSGNNDLSASVERILKLQERNAELFKKFFDELRKEKGLEISKTAVDNKFLKAYLRSGK